jgi:hypothetical protein
MATRVFDKPSDHREGARELLAYYVYLRDEVARRRDPTLGEYFADQADRIIKGIGGRDPLTNVAALDAVLMQASTGVSFSGSAFTAMDPGGVTAD